MKYIGYFKSINDIPYKVVIDTGGTGQTEITMGADPFMVKYEGESTIYKPLKLSSASLNIVSKSYLFDVYSAEAQGTKIQLFKNETELEWSGYIEPNLYSQDFNKDYENIELNAVDALSSLDYFKYETVEEGKKGIVSLGNVVYTAIQKAAGDYNKLHFIMSNQRSDYDPLSPECVLNKMYISEQNFFDEDGVPMTYKEVLEEIMQYTGYTLLAYKNSVYILDYDAIKNGFGKYYIYHTVDNFNTHYTTIETITHNKAITSSDFSNSETSITLDEVFNKVSVITSLYNYNSLLPDIWNPEDLTNYTKVWNSTELNVYNHYNTEKGTYQKNHFYRYYTHNKYRSYYYNKTNWQPVELPAFNRELFNTQGTILKPFINDTIGATIVKYVNYNKDEIVSKLNFEDYILLHRHLPASGSDGRSEKVFELKSENIPSSTYSETSYLVISAEALWDDREGAVYIDPDYKPTNDTFGYSELFLNCLLKVGDKYWNGSSWSNYTRGGFFLPFADSSTDTSHYLNRWFPVINTVDYRYEIDAVGYAIPITSEDELMGDIEFYINSPDNVNTFKRAENVWVKGLEMKIYRPYINPDESSNTDTIYENVIDDDFVKEGKELKFKICTQTGKGWSYSSVFFINGNYIYTLKNIPLNITQTPEKTIIQKYVNQYSTPSKILDISIKNDIYPYTALTIGILSGTFIVDTMEIDYYYDKNKVKLVEKK